MKKIIKNLLFIVNIISFILAYIVTIFIFCCEIFGYNKGYDFLEKISFPLNGKGLIIVGYICTAIMIISYFIRKKYFK